MNNRVPVLAAGIVSAKRAGQFRTAWPGLCEDEAMAGARAWLRRAGLACVLGVTRSLNKVLPRVGEDPHFQH